MFTDVIVPPMRAYVNQSERNQRKQTEVLRKQTESRFWKCKNQKERQESREPGANTVTD